MNLARPGGVIVKMASPDAREVVHLAKRFGAQFDRRGTAGTAYRIINGFIVKAFKQGDGFSTIVTILAPAGQWLFGAYTRAVPDISPRSGEVVDPREYNLTDDGCPIINGAGWDFPASIKVKEPVEWREGSGWEFDPLKLKFFPKVCYIQNTESSGSPLDTSHAPLSVSRHHLISVAMLTTAPSRNAMTNNALDVSVFSSGAVPRHALNGEKIAEEPDGIPVKDATMQRLLLQATDIASMFRGATNTGKAGYINSEGIYRTVQGALAKKPASAYMLRNETTGKYTDLLIITPLQWLGAQNAVALERMEKNQLTFGDKVAVLVSASTNCESGHGVAIIDMAFTPDDKEAVAAGAQRVPLDGRVTAAHAVKASEYGSAHGFGTHIAYFKEVLAIEQDPDTKAWKVKKDRLVPINTTVSEISSVLSFGTACRQGLPGTEPNPPRTLLSGEMPDYYGPAQSIIGVSRIQYYASPSIPTRYLPGTRDDPPPEYQARAVISTRIFVQTYENGGVSEVSYLLQSQDVFLKVENFDSTGGELPPKFPWPDTVARYYFYASSGPALAAVVVPIAPNVEVPEFVEPPKEPPEDFSYYNSNAFDGQQHASAKFVLFTFRNGSFGRVEFDLGRYEPPRPMMYGVSIGGAFNAYLDGSSIGQFWYDRPGKLSTDTTYDSHTKVIAPVFGVLPEDLAPSSESRSGRPTWSDYPVKGPFKLDEDDPNVTEEILRRNDYYRFTQRRSSSCSTEQRRIHAHLGQGRIAILATADASASQIYVTWTLLIANESTGELVEVRGDIPSRDSRGYPLESSGWLNLNMISPEKRDAEGSVVVPAVLVVSVDRPTTWTEAGGFYGRANPSGRPDPDIVSNDPDNPLFQNLMYNNTVGEARYIRSEPYKFEANNRDNSCEKYISWDGGLTWTLFIENMPGDVYCLGSPLGVSTFIP